MTWERNQRNRDRQSRQRKRLLDELNYYKQNTFAPKDQEETLQRIKVLERGIEHNGVPGTYR